MPISSFAITIITIGILFILMLFSLSAQTMALFGLLLMLPVAALFINRPRMWLGLIIFLFPTNFFLPFVSQNIPLFDLMAVPFCLFVLLDQIMGSRSAATYRAPMRLGVILFAAIMIVTMNIRGVGLSMLGSDLWGGSVYVSVLCRIGLLLAVTVVELPTALWRRFIILLTLGSLIPTLSQLTFTFSGGAIYHQYNFIKFSQLDLGTLNALELGEGLARFQTGGAGTILGFLPFLLFRDTFRGSAMVASVLIWTLSIIMIGASGYRSELLSLLMVWGFIMWLGKQRFQIGRSLLLLSMAIGLICVAALSARQYPASVQRVLTVVPFADVSAEVRYDATETLDWRINIWKEAAKEIPDYLLIGKGLAFDGREYTASLTQADFNNIWPLITRTYHNGPLGLLLIFGIPGLVLGIVLLIGGCIRYLKAYRQPWPDEDLQNAYRVVLAWFLTQVVSFLFIYGDFQASFTTFFFQMMLLEGMLRSRWSQQKKAGEEATVEKPEPEPQLTGWGTTT